MYTTTTSTTTNIGAVVCDSTINCIYTYNIVSKHNYITIDLSGVGVYGIWYWVFDC